MRRILVEHARHKKRLRHGGGTRRLDLGAIDLVAATPSDDDLVALDEALEQLSHKDPVSAQLVKLCYFAGLSREEAAKALGMSLRTAERNWTYARTWLHRAISRGDDTGPA
jgi:RNA polymerase sigma factor (TIGR02999 family)